MQQILEYITLFRVVWIGGRLGFGKTALAVLIAEQLMKRGLVDGVISNFPTTFPAHYQQDDGTLHNRCIIYDEAWADLDSRTSMTNDRAYGAFARKMGAYWVFPSVHPIDKRLRAVEIKPSHKNVITGDTVWQYRVNDDERKPTTGKFSVVMKDAYGRYSTSFIPLTDCGISSRFSLSHYKETGVFYGQQQKQYEKRSGKELALAVTGD